MGHISIRRSSQVGQAAVLIALCMFSMVVFLAMATNFGILVNDRIRMQNAADLSAYAGAFEQARIMNRITQLNRRIYNIAEQTRMQMTCRDMPDLDEAMYADEDSQAECNSGERRVFIALGCEDPPRLPKAYLDMQQARIDILSASIKGLNYRGKGSPNRAARFTALRNIPGLGRPRHHTFYEWNPNSPTSKDIPPDEMVQLDQVTTTINYVQWYRRGMCDCPAWLAPFVPNIPGCLRLMQPYLLKSWYVKHVPGPTVFFPARVNGVPKKNFLDINNRRGGYFGADAELGRGGSDELWAYAAAKPFGGNIGTTDGQGGDAHWEVFKFFLKQKPFYVWDFENFEDAESMKKFVPEYRARMAGLKEEFMDSDGKMLLPIDLIATDSIMGTQFSSSSIATHSSH